MQPFAPDATAAALEGESMCRLVVRIAVVVAERRQVPVREALGWDTALPRESRWQSLIRRP